MPKSKSSKASVREKHDSPLAAEAALGRLIMLGKLIERHGDRHDPVILDDLKGDDLLNLGSMIREYAEIALDDVEGLRFDQGHGIFREAANA